MRNARFSITISQFSSFLRSFPAQGQTAIPVLSWSGYLVSAIKQADKECGSCGCELDPLYKKALELI